MDSLASEINWLIINLLTTTDYLNYSLINNRNYTENKLHLQFRLLTSRLTKSLLNYQYQSFRDNLVKLHKYRHQYDIINLVNLLLFTLFNQINTELPAIWLTQCGGYYDIRYLYLLLREGGRIDKKKVTSIFSNIIYDRYYHLIINNNFNIEKIRQDRPLDPTLTILETDK